MTLMFQNLSKSIIRCSMHIMWGLTRTDTNEYSRFINIVNRNKTMLPDLIIIGPRVDTVGKLLSEFHFRPGYQGPVVPSFTYRTIPSIFAG